MKGGGLLNAFFIGAGFFALVDLALYRWIEAPREPDHDEMRRHDETRYDLSRM